MLLEKEHRLEDILAQYKRVALAFSGGADSSLLLHKALQALGPENVLVLTARSCLLTASEVEKAVSWPHRHGYEDGQIQHHVIELDPLAWDEFVQNPQDRCYLCKSKVYTAFRDICLEHGIEHLIDGTNFDDLHSDRPGLRALKELSIDTPLANAELTKKEVRILSRELALDTWDHPSASCLATRIPTGLSITVERMGRIEKMEAGLTSLGFNGCRVRLDSLNDQKVYIQVQRQDVAGAAREMNRDSISNLFNDFGVKKIFLDLDGR